MDYYKYGNVYHKWSNFNFIKFKIRILKILTFFWKIKLLEEQKVNNSMINRFLKHYDIYFLPIVNPGKKIKLSIQNQTIILFCLLFSDGYEFSRNVKPLWRKNLRDYDGLKNCKHFYTFLTCCLKFS